MRRGDDRQYTVDLVPVQRQEGRIDRRVEHKRKLYCLRHTEADSREIIECGMTNFRIDRIGRHRHASAPILTTSTRQNRDRGMKVQFPGVNIGQTAGKVSKQMDSCI